MYSTFLNDILDKLPTIPTKVVSSTFAVIPSFLPILGHQLNDSPCSLVAESNPASALFSYHLYHHIYTVLII
jgi:hypothetical protein